MTERGSYCRINSAVQITLLPFKYRPSHYTTLKFHTARSEKCWTWPFVFSAGRHLCFLSPSFVTIILLSLIIYQNTQLVSKVSSPAWPLPSLSTVVLIPFRVGSHILSERTLKKGRGPFFSKCSFNLSFSLYLICLWVGWGLVCF